MASIPCALGMGTLIYLIFHYTPELNFIKPTIHKVTDTFLPYCVFVMLFSSFCKIELRYMKIRVWHWYLALVQILLPFATVLVILQVSNSVYTTALMGFFICAICPTAASAAVITSKLGGSESSLTTYMIISNFVAAIFIPLFLTVLSIDSSYTFLQEFFIILNKVFPIIVLPLFLALFTRKYLHKLHSIMVNELKDLSFYIWTFSLTILTGKSLANLINADESFLSLVLMFISSILVCLVQFAIGKLIGSKYGYRITAGQGLGQKNMIFCIWVALTFLNPAVAIIPGLFVIWQNLLNSAQLIIVKKRNSYARKHNLPIYKEL